MAQMDQTIRQTRRVLRGLANPADGTVAPAPIDAGTDIPTAATDGIDRSVMAER
jgi:hypothetical protein